MTNTLQRVISGTILVSLVILCLNLGPNYFIGLIFLFGVFSLDEIYCNFLKKKRFDLLYITQQICFATFLMFCSVFYQTLSLFNIFNILSIGLNILLIVYLFLVKPYSTTLLYTITKIPYLLAMALCFSLLTIAELTFFPNWQYIIAFLLLLAFSSDTAAWFFGRAIGRTPLCPKIGPSKTVEGFIGGILSAGVVGGAFGGRVLDNISLTFCLVFCCLGLIAQMGDLIGSKIKRQFNIKDSSSLIPGHGGAFDRIDGLILLAPFYSILLKSYYSM